MGDDNPLQGGETRTYTRAYGGGLVPGVLHRVGVNNPIVWCVMSDFYDWQRTLSYDADVTMVIGARGIGKTFGLRMQCIRDFMRDGSRFVEITRYKNEVSGVSEGYYNRLARQAEFSGLVFKTDSRYAYIAERPDKGKKPEWHLSGYFVALSDSQRLKKRTFDKVRRLIFDEAIIERSDRYHRYLPDEFGTLANVVDTVSRERGDTDSLRPRVYLLGNACDLANPYFAAYGVGTDLRFGRRWYAGKTFLLDYVDPGDYSAEKSAKTVAGRMFANTDAGDVAVANEFRHERSEFIAQKPRRARFSFGVVCNGRRYGVWLDQTEGYYYVTGRIPRNTGQPIYSLTRMDASINYVAANSLSGTLRYISDMFYMGLLRYENESVMVGFGDVLRMFGIR